MVSSLRKMWFGRFYAKHLKRHNAIRWAFHWCWRNGYPLYVNHLAALLSSPARIRAIRWRPLIRLKEFSQISRTPTYKIAAGAEVVTPEPKVFPRSCQKDLLSPHERFQFPDIYVVPINNGMIFGGSNLILAGGKVVCHDLYDFECDYTSEELHGRTLIQPKSRRIRLLVHDEWPERVPAAATFVDACAPNYAHWLTEVLPRVALFCGDERFQNIPIVVNDGLHRNILESLYLVTGPEREIITLPIGRALYCNRLYNTSASGYVPFGWRTNKPPGCAHGTFSPPALNMLRRHLKGLVPNTEPRVWPEMIFLRRNSESRKIVNGINVEQLFLSRGYSIVEPEKLTFLEQVALFNNAKVIVGSSGAAMANMIFSPRESKVVILISKHPDTIYWYWQNIACVFGKSVIYSLGEISDGGAAGIHSSFNVNLDDLRSLLSEMEDRSGNHYQLDSVSDYMKKMGRRHKLSSASENRKSLT